MTTSGWSFSWATCNERPMSASAGIIESIVKALSAISPASMTVISRVPGRLTPSWLRESNMGGRVCWPIASTRATVAHERGSNDDEFCDEAPWLLAGDGRNSHHYDAAVGSCLRPGCRGVAGNPDSAG